VATQALFTFAKADLDLTPNLQVVLSHGGTVYSITPLNRFSQYEVLIPVDESFAILASGQGKYFAEVTKCFNIFQLDAAESSASQGFVVNATWGGDVLQSPTVIVCVVFPSDSLLPPGSSQELLVSVELFTGFVPVSTSLDELVADGTISSYRIEGRKTLFLVSVEETVCWTFATNRDFNTTEVEAVSSVAVSSVDPTLVTASVMPDPCAEEGIDYGAVGALLSNNVREGLECQNEMVTASGLPWWAWLLIGLGCVAVGVVVAFLIRYCFILERRKRKATHAARVAKRTGTQDRLPSGSIVRPQFEKTATNLGM
jgi:hypothetical protein